MRTDSGGFHYIAIDGPNFVNRLIDAGVPKQIILESISFADISATIQMVIRREIGTQRSMGTEFFYSSNTFGGDSEWAFNATETKAFISRISSETGVETTLIDLPSSNQKEKGVDIAVAAAMFEKSQFCETLVLGSSDKDFVPVLGSIKRMGRYVVTLGFGDAHPPELINISFLTIRLQFKSSGKCYLLS